MLAIKKKNYYTSLKKKKKRTGVVRNMNLLFLFFIFLKSEIKKLTNHSKGNFKFPVSAH